MASATPPKTPAKRTVSAASAKPKASPRTGSAQVKPRIASGGARAPSSPKAAPKTISVRAKAVPVIAAPLLAGKEKIKKAKLVRDSFTMPENEYAALGEVKKACLKAGFEVKKSELLRIGVALIRKLDLVAVKGAVAALAPLKPGRPRKER